MLKIEIKTVGTLSNVGVLIFKYSYPKRHGAETTIKLSFLPLFLWLNLIVRSFVFPLFFFTIVLYSFEVVIFIYTL